MVDMPFLQQLGAWIAGAAAFLGPWGVFLIALADSALVPMPQGVDTLLIAQAIATPETAYLGAALGTADRFLEASSFTAWHAGPESQSWSAASRSMGCESCGGPWASGAPPRSYRSP